MESKEIQKRELTPAQKMVSGFNGFLERYKGQIGRAAPKNFDPDRLCRVVLSMYRSTPDLMKCSHESLMGGVLMCAQMGLEPGPLGEAYLVPFNNTKKGIKEAQFILGYKGMMKLARRSGEISSIYGHAVYENDFFRFVYGMNEELSHIPWHSLDRPASEPGAFRGAYVIVKFKNGEVLPWFLPKAEIERHRERSKAKDSTFWRDNYEKMAIKTVVRDMQPWLPMTVEDQRTVQSFDGAVKTQIADDMTDVPSENDAYEDAEITDGPSDAVAKPSFKDRLKAAKPTEPSAPEPPPLEKAFTDAQNLVLALPPKYLAKARGLTNVSTPIGNLTDDDCSKLLDAAEGLSHAAAQTEEEEDDRF